MEKIFFEHSYDNEHEFCFYLFQSWDFDDCKISAAVVKLFVDQEPVQEVAKNMAVPEDEVMLLCLDHVWRGKLLQKLS